MRVSSLLILFFSMILSSCSKEKKEPLPTDVFVLNEPIIMGDTIKLNWSNYLEGNIAEITVYKKDFDDTDFYPLTYFSPPREGNEITDINLTYSPSISYQFEVKLGNDNKVMSNIVTYKRPKIQILDIDPYDVIYREEDQLLYFFEASGQISLYDLKTNQITKQVQVERGLKYADIETFQNKKELYVPSYSGVHVFDALTLEKIDHFYQGLSTFSVVSHHNLLYVSASEPFDQALQVLRRSDKKTIGQIEFFQLHRIRKIPNSNTKLLGVTTLSYPSDQRTFEFNQEGESPKIVSDLYHSDYPLESSILSIFPNGQKYITAREGTIYNIDMTFDANLPRGNLEFTSFSYDKQSSKIYAATSTRSIEVYSANTYEHLKSIKTNGHPLRIFALDDEILSVSFPAEIDRAHYYYNEYNSIDTDNRLVIERLPK